MPDFDDRNADAGTDRSRAIFADKATENESTLLLRDRENIDPLFLGRYPHVVSKRRPPENFLDFPGCSAYEIPMENAPGEQPVGVVREPAENDNAPGFQVLVASRQKRKKKVAVQVIGKAGRIDDVLRPETVAHLSKGPFQRVFGHEPDSRPMISGIDLFVDISKRVGVDIDARGVNFLGERAFGQKLEKLPAGAASQAHDVDAPLV